MDLPSHDEVVEQIDAFLARHAMAPSRLGRDAFGEAQFVASVRAGRVPGLDRLRELSKFIRERDLAAGFVMGDEGNDAVEPPHRLNAGAR